MNIKQNLVISGIALAILTSLVSCTKERQAQQVFDWAKVKQSGVDLGKGVSPELIWVNPG